MNQKDQLALKWARRRFAVKYYFVSDPVGVIEGHADPVMLMTVTDSGGNADRHKYNCPVGYPAILVAWRPTAATTDRATWHIFPLTFEGYDVFYLLDVIAFQDTELS